MAITLDGNGTIGGLSAGGLPDATVTPAELTQPLTLDTAKASTSGTSINFTGIPSWVKRITVMFSGVSTNGTSALLVQLGTGSTTYTTSGYVSSSAGVSSSPGISNVTTGFNVRTDGATQIVSGILTVANISGNSWVSSHSAKQSTTTTIVGGGDVTLSATLTAVRITTVNGTDTFDAGTMNIMYE